MRAFLWATAAWALPALLSCSHPATGPVVADPPPAVDQPPAHRSADALRQLAEQLWHARLEQDWAAIFPFQDPKSVEDVTEADFVAWCEAEEPFHILEYRLGDVLISDGMGWVEVHSRTAMRRFPDIPPRDTYRWEKWRLLEDRWYPVPPRQLEEYPASPAQRDAAEEQRLLARFEESWEARQTGDWDRLFQLSDPRTRSDIPRDEFAEAQGLIDYLSRKVRWVEVIGERGNIRVEVLHKLTDPSLTKLSPKLAVVTERWVKVENEWYRDLTIANQ